MDREQKEPGWAREIRERLLRLETKVDIFGRLLEGAEGQRAARRRRGRDKRSRAKGPPPNDVR